MAKGKHITIDWKQFVQSNILLLNWFYDEDTFSLAFDPENPYDYWALDVSNFPPLLTHRVGFTGSPCHHICCRFMHFRSRNLLLICNLFALHKLWIDCDFDLFVYAIIIHILNELQHTSSSCGHKPNEAKENDSFITLIVCENNNTEAKPSSHQFC